MYKYGFSLAAVLLSLSAAGQTDPPAMTRKWSESQALTRAAPTLTTEGLDLSDIAGFRVTVCAASGQTLAGAGALQAYVYDNDLALWTRNPSLDITISTAGARCLTFADIQTVVATGRGLFAATGVTVSGGTTVTVQMKAWTRRAK